MSARGFDPGIAASASAAQRDAADPACHVFVEANAGSGKTRVLVDRVARLLLRQVAPEDILCVTFTKAAAGEMQTRLYRKLGDWSVMADEKLREELRDLAGDGGQPDLAAARRLFARALETPGGLKIQTLHAYCESLLRRFPLEAGLPPGFATQEDARSAALSAEAIADVLARAAAEPEGALGRAVASVLDACGPTGLETIVKFAGSERHGFADALAGAGGVAALKTKAAEKLGAERGADPDSIRAEAWDGADQAALASCCRALLDGSPNDVKAGARLQAALDAGHADGSETFFEAYRDYLLTEKGDWRKKFYTKTCDHCAELVALFAPDTGSERMRMQAILERVAAAQALALTEAGIELAAAFIAAYEAALRRMRAVDFGDLVVGAKRLLTDSAAKDWTLYKLDRGLEHVLVDEAQDTAPDQWAVIDALTEEFFAGEDGSNRERTVFCVGDEKQSIYSFQKADPKLFIAQGRKLERASAEAGLGFARPALDVSFRSSPEVLQAVDLAFAAEAEGLGAPETKFAGPPPGEKNDRSDVSAPFHAYAGHRAARRGTPGCVEIWPAVPRPLAEEETSIALPVDRQPVNSARNQLAQAVAQEIADILDRGDRVWAEARPNWTARPAQPGDIVVLVRTRGGGLFDEIIRQLKIRNVPVAGADRMTLSDQLVVQDLISLAEWALLPEDDLSLAEILKSPFFHPVGEAAPIGDDALFDLTRRRERRLWDKLRATGDPRFTEAREALERARARVDADAPYAFFASFLGETTPTGETRLARLYARLGEEARDPVEEFLSRALAHEREGAPSLARFIHAMAADASEIKREMEAGRGEVRVMTVHAAKGLEAPIVFLPDTTQKPRSRFTGLAADPEAGLLWAPEAKSDLPAIAAVREAGEAADAAESARLLYVALTRARDRLIVCGAKHGAKEGRVDDDSWHARLDAAWSGEDWSEASTALDAVAAANGWEGSAARRFGETPAPLGRATGLRPAQTEPPVWARSPAPEEPRAPRALAPSKLIEEEAGGFEPPSLSPLAGGGPDRFLRGSLIHKLLQTLPDVPPERRADSARRFLAVRRELGEAQRAEILSETLAVLDHPEFAPIFGPGSRAEVAVTGRAPGLPDGVTVNGQIDRLVVTDHAVLIIDFKTNRPPPKRTEDVQPVYLAQMAAYRALLAALHPERPVRCALLWTDGPTLMELPAEALDGALPGAGRRAPS